MSGLIIALKKGISKTFKFIKKTIKKVVKSKIFKAVVIAAAVYFTAGLAAGMLAPTASIGAAALAPGAGVLAAGNGGLALAGAAGSATAATTASLGSTLIQGVAKMGSLAAKNPLITSTLMQTGGTMLAGASKAKSEQKAYDKEEEQLLVNNKTVLPIKERLAALNSKYLGQPQAQPVATQQPTAQSQVAGSFYDPRTDSYKEHA